MVNPERSYGQRWRRLGLIFSASLVSVTTGGCSTGVPLHADISARPSAVLTLAWAKAKRTTQGIVVGGQIRQVHCCAYVRGHIHVEAKDQNGVELAAADVPWGDFNLRDFHLAWFKATLPVPPQASVSAIEIQFSAHRN